MLAEKRKRSANFSADEKMRFLRILQRKGKVIISKVNSHDYVTNKAKEEAWVEITSDLNACGNIPRTTDNLKKLWQKLKQEAKTLKSIANQGQGTGGRPSKKMDDPVLELVAKIIGCDSWEIEMVDCDSEALYLKTSTPELQTSTESDLEEPAENADVTTLIDVKHNIQLLDDVASSMEVHKEGSAKCKPHKAQRHIKRSLSNLDCNTNERSNVKPTNVLLNNDFASERLKCEKAKRELINLQKQQMIEEHNQKMKQAELKSKILETVLKKIQDEKPVDSELFKIITNL